MQKKEKDGWMGQGGGDHREKQTARVCVSICCRVPFFL